MNFFIASNYNLNFLRKGTKNIGFRQQKIYETSLRRTVVLQQFYSAKNTTNETNKNFKYQKLSKPARFNAYVTNELDR